MSDSRLRGIERKFKESGVKDDYLAYLVERVRVGDCPNYECARRFLSQDDEQSCVLTDDFKLFSLRDTIEILVMEHLKGRDSFFYTSILTSSLLIPEHKGDYVFLQECDYLTGKDLLFSNIHLGGLRVSSDVNGGLLLSMEQMRENYFLQYALGVPLLNVYADILENNFDVTAFFIGDLRHEHVPLRGIQTLPVYKASGAPAATGFDVSVRENFYLLR